MLEVLEEGLRNRQTAAHQMNDRSSRSHTILTIQMHSTTTEEEENETQGACVCCCSAPSCSPPLPSRPALPTPSTVVQRHGSISFVDLAGSERVSRTRSEGQTLVESNNINKSLLTLGVCISNLADPRKRKGHIPYRDSALTMLLKDSLGGTGMTLMIACVSPSHLSCQVGGQEKRARGRRGRQRPRHVQLICHPARFCLPLGNPQYASLRLARQANPEQAHH